MLLFSFVTTGRDSNLVGTDRQGECDGLFLRLVVLLSSRGRYGNSTCWRFVLALRFNYTSERSLAASPTFRSWAGRRHASGASPIVRSRAGLYLRWHSSFCTTTTIGSWTGRRHASEAFPIVRSRAGLYLHWHSSFCTMTTIGIPQLQSLCHATAHDDDIRGQEAHRNRRGGGVKGCKSMSSD